MTRKIFINYRRGDDPGSAGRLFDRLEQAFEPDELFMDVDNIPPGHDFVDVLDKQVAECDVFLAVIGEAWLHSTDAAGQRRLDDPADFVRVEIELALMRRKRLIPVLVNDAKMPRADDLPGSLARLARHQAVRLSHDSFRTDSERLIRELEAALAEAADKRKERARQQREAREREQAEEEAWRQAKEEQQRREAEERRQAEVEARRQAEEEQRRREARERRQAEAEARRPLEEEQRRREARRKQAEEQEQAEEQAERERQAARARLDEAVEAPPRRAIDRSAPENRWRWILGGGGAALAALVAVVIISTQNGTDISDLERTARTQAKTEPETAQEEIESPLSTLEPSAGTAASQTGAPLEPFRDCTECPEMVVIPAGRFVMGSPADEAGRRDNESRQREVTIPAFAMGKYEVTFGEWDACVAGGGCSHKPEDKWGRGRQPVMRVSWQDAQEYVGWLSERTGESYRLPSESEWEYAVRAGTTTAYAFGEEITSEQANFWPHVKQTTEVGSYPANRWDLHDMHGNAWEWVEDCWNESYEGAPTDGTAWLQGNCSLRILRGGSWNVNPEGLRSAFRLRIEPDLRVSSRGFRLARAFTP